jgi:hypothetical protein
MLRQDWQQVLELIKARRRVAWMMLQNASVVSLEENVLLLRFPRQGDVKGFTTGQYDETLKEALNARYGANLVIRAVSGPEGGSGGRGSGGSGGGDGGAPAGGRALAPASPGSAAPPAAPSAEPQADDVPFPSGADFDGDDDGDDGTSDDGSGIGDGDSGSGDSGSGDFSDADLDPVDAVDPDGGGFGAGGAGSGRAGAGAGTRGGDTSLPAADLSGIALVQRELGGEIIAEYED